MALSNKSSRFASPATENPLNNSYQTSLFEEKAGSLSAYAGFEANNNGMVPGGTLEYTSPPVPTTTTTTTTTTSTTTTTTTV